MDRLLKAIILSLTPLVLACGGGSPEGVRPFTDVLSRLAKDNKFTYLSPPLAGLKTGWVMDNAGVRSTTCWNTKSQNLRSLAGVTVAGTDSSGLSMNLGVRLLSLFGVGFSLNNNTAKRVDLTLTEWSTVEGADLSFRWDSTQCVADLERGPARVLRRLLNFASLTATVVTDRGLKIGLDSTSIKSGEVTVNIDAGKAEFRSNGTITAKADSISVGARHAEWKLNKFSCPQATTFQLPATKQMFAPGPCPGDRSTWYRIGVFGTSANGLQVRYQNLSTPGAAPHDTVVAAGTSFLLTSLSRRADIATINERAPGNYDVQLERFELTQSALLGAAPMLSDNQASSDLTVGESLSPE